MDKDEGLPGAEKSWKKLGKRGKKDGKMRGKSKKI